MPKPTFYNLSEQKKAHIKQAAILEFATHGYFNANVSRITKSCKVATGSFYQYFEDITDLFAYLVQDIAQLKVTYIQEERAHIDESNFEESLRAIYKGGMRFALHAPHCYMLSNRFMEIVKTPVFEKVMGYMHHTDEAIQKEQQWFEAFIARAIEEGHIAPYVDVALFMKLIEQINLTVIEHTGILHNPEQFTEANIQAFCDLAVRILLHGVSGSKA